VTPATSCRRARFGLWIAIALAGPVPAARAEVSGDLLLLGRYGDRVYTTPRDHTRLYGRTDLGWRQDGFALGGRVEFDRSSDNDPLGGRLTQYERITQRWAEWRDAHVLVRAGHFHTILGHGLLHRSYELPGVVYDEPGSGTRYAASRDVDGALLELAAGPFAWRSFTGRFNDATFSPASEALGAPRYGSTLTGAQAEVRLPWNGRIGAAALRSAPGASPRRTFASGSAGVDALSPWAAAGVSLPIAFEYAREAGHLDDWLRFSRDAAVAHALYGSAAFLWRGWSLAAEVKDYAGFRLGFNDPPPLVREHTWSLLNRNTHLLDAESERGHQLALETPAWRGLGLTAHFSRADGQPPFQQDFRYEEQFVELRFAAPANDAWEVRAYADRGFDTHDFIGDRDAAGVSLAARGPLGLAGELDVEHQRVVRAGLLATEPFDDVALTLGVSRSGWGSAGVTVVRTTDVLDRPSDVFGNPTAPSATFTGVTLAADVMTRHRAELFAGRRRGGRACVSGTCYDVPSLDGAELRWTSRFP
jgi:hypothetical protein